MLALRVCPPHHPAQLCTGGTQSMLWVTIAEDELSNERVSCDRFLASGAKVDVLVVVAKHGSR